MQRLLPVALGGRGLQRPGPPGQLRLARLLHLHLDEKHCRPDPERFTCTGGGGGERASEPASERSGRPTMAKWRGGGREVLRGKHLQLDASVDRLEAGGQVELSVAHLQSEGHSILNFNPKITKCIFFHICGDLGLEEFVLFRLSICLSGLQGGRPVHC